MYVSFVNAQIFKFTGRFVTAYRSKFKRIVIATRPRFSGYFLCWQSQIHGIFVNDSKSSYTGLSANIHRQKFGEHFW